MTMKQEAYRDITRMAVDLFQHSDAPAKATEAIPQTTQPAVASPRPHDFQKTIDLFQGSGK